MALTNIESPKIYFYNEKILDKDDKITKRVLTGLENILHAYTIYVPQYSKAHDNNPKNFKIESVYLIGSAIRESKVDSDLDLMLIAPQIDVTAERDIKIFLNIFFYNNLPKNKAVDAYVRPYDKFPDRPSLNITNQVKKLLKIYNKKLE